MLSLMARQYNLNTQKIIALADGKRSSVQIAELVGLTPRYVRKVLLRLDLPRLHEGAQPGKANHQYKTGRRIDLDGYVLVTAPKDHPYARPRPNRKTKLMYEHRLVLEHTLGRYLLPEEVVDHVDGLTLHNSPENLRLFPSNAAHLSATKAGSAPNLSAAGSQNTGKRTDRGTVIERVDMHAIRRRRGDVRLRQILLAALSLGTDSQFLLGTHHHTTKAGIDMSSRSTIELALADLYARWEVAHVP
jgi:hypothetical protein